MILICRVRLSRIEMAHNNNINMKTDTISLLFTCTVHVILKNIR